MKSKIILFLTSFLLIINTVNAQKSSKTEKRTLVGISYSLAKASLSSEENKISFDIKNSSSVGITVFHRLNNTFGLEGGIEYSLFDVEQKIKNGNQVDTTQTNLSLLEVPMLVRFPIQKHFYLNGGLLLNLDMNSTSAVSSQSGIGLMAGAGAMYQFKTGFSIFANPYVKMHSLLRFQSVKEKNSLIEYGVKLGVAYQF